MIEIVFVIKIVMHRQIMKSKQIGILLTLDHILKQSMYLVVEFEGPVVDVDVLKLEVIDKVL